MPYNLPGVVIRPVTNPARSKKCPHCKRTYHAAILRKRNKHIYGYCPHCNGLVSPPSEFSREEFEYKEDTAKPDEKFWGMGLFEDKLKPLFLTRDGQYGFLDEQTWLHSIVYTAATEAVAVCNALEELEYLLNQGTIKEATLQDFFERNSILLLDYEYKKVHPHIELIRDEGPLIPDFMLEPAGQDVLCDILDLKLPSAKVYITQKNRERYSAAVLEACAQLREYSAYFEQDRNRELIYQTYGLKAYRPKMIVVIGRKSSIDPIAVRRIEGDTPHLVLRTYDDIITNAKARLGKR